MQEERYEDLIKEWPKIIGIYVDLDDLCLSIQGQIDQFAREHRSEKAICWYSKQSFVYKLINKALRTEYMDLLYKFRFFISWSNKRSTA